MNECGLNVVRTVNSYRKWRDSIPKDESLGFVPTMGSLHSGHLSLFERCALENKYSVFCIFVNPIQFSANEDFDSYPHAFNDDLHKIGTIGTLAKNRTIIFTPSIEEIYPYGHSEDHFGTYVNFEDFPKLMEAKRRPIHFRGVCTVVAKLLNIVYPSTLYLGQKDYEQSCILRRMVADLFFPITVEVCPIIRENSGLALSSRNVFLKEDEQKIAPELYKSLLLGKEQFLSGKSSEEAVKLVKNNLLEKGISKIDYVYIVKNNLQLVQKVEDLTMYDECAICAAIEFDKVHILDNEIIKTDPSLVTN